MILLRSQFCSYPVYSRCFALLCSALFCWLFCSVLLRAEIDEAKSCFLVSRVFSPSNHFALDGCVSPKLSIYLFAPWALFGVLPWITRREFPVRKDFHFLFCRAMSIISRACFLEVLIFISSCFCDHNGFLIFTFWTVFGFSVFSTLFSELGFVHSIQQNVAV